ncbi:MAG: hypothetical protein NT085_03505 [candidate division SR1 bacterium]|nr:hypothetical protein [candidate division SR1 bacterium]
MGYILGMTVEAPKNSNNEINKDKTLYDIVQAMGLNFVNVAHDLAKMAGIKDYKGTAPQNIEIRRKILSGELMPVKDLKTASNVFSSEKQKVILQVIGKDITIEQMNTYIANLPPNKVKILENLKNTEFVGFLRQEIKTVIAHVDKSKVEGNTDEINVTFAERTASMIEVNNLETSLRLFLEKNNENYDNIYKKANIIEKWNEKEFSGTKDKLLKKYNNNEEEAKKHFNMTFMTAEVYKDKSLSQNQEFKNIASGVYAYNEGLGIDLKSLWGEEFYASVQSRYLEQKTYQAQRDTYGESFSSIDQLQSIENDDMIKTNIKIEKWVLEENKDYEYYKNLVKIDTNFYNILQNDVTSKKLLNIENPTKEEKKIIVDMMKKKSGLTEESEKGLKEETNNIIKEQLKYFETLYGYRSYGARKCIG